jgi:hypothetical protein
LSFYPVTVHESRKVIIGTPFYFSPLSQPVMERLRLKRSLESVIKNKYLEMEAGDQEKKLMTPTTN